MEAEHESLHIQKRRSKADQERLKQIDAKLSKHKFHMTKLETLLRLLENESLSVEDIDSVKESVDYYIDSNSV